MITLAIFVGLVVVIAICCRADVRRRWAEHREFDRAHIDALERIHQGPKPRRLGRW